MSLVDAIFTARQELRSLRFFRQVVGLRCVPEVGHRFRPASYLDPLHRHGQTWQCEDCGMVSCSEPGPPYEPEHPSFLKSPAAHGPNGGWMSHHDIAERQRRIVEREAEEAKWRTRQGHDIYLHDEHWACIHMCRSWPDSTPGMAPFHVWVCLQCGEEIRQQIASSFSFGTGPSGAIAYGTQDRLSSPGGLESEGDRVLTQKMFHLQSHGVDVEAILRQRRAMQQQIEVRMSNMTCQGSPAEIARQSMAWR